MWCDGSETSSSSSAIHVRYVGRNLWLNPPSRKLWPSQPTWRRGWGPARTGEWWTVSWWGWRRLQTNTKQLLTTLSLGRVLGPGSADNTRPAQRCCSQDGAGQGAGAGRCPGHTAICHCVLSPVLTLLTAVLSLHTAAVTALLSAAARFRLPSAREWWCGRAGRGGAGAAAGAGGGRQRM